MDDRAADFGRKGESAELIIDDLGIAAAIGEGRDSPHEVAALADHPAGPEHIVRGQ